MGSEPALSGSELPGQEEWFMITGSPLQSAINNSSNPPACALSEEIVGPAFRQIKYELYCATVDLLGFSLETGPDRNCTVRSAYHLNGDNNDKLEFEFIYDQEQKRYTEAVWSSHLQEYADLYHYWVLDRQCMPGFLAEVFLQLYNQRGTPPCRPILRRHNP